jgi:hypothetical protein
MDKDPAERKPFLTRANQLLRATTQVASYVWWKSGRTRAPVDASYAAVVTGSSTTSPAVGGWVS